MSCVLSLVSCVVCRVSCVVCGVVFPMARTPQAEPLEVVSFLLHFFSLFSFAPCVVPLVINPVCRVPVAQWVVSQCAVSRNAILP